MIAIDKVMDFSKLLGLPKIYTNEVKGGKIWLFRKDNLDV